MKLTEKRGQILRQLTIKGSVEEQELKCSKHTKLETRKLFLTHKLIHVEDIPARKTGPGGRPRKLWVVEINGVISALKNDLVEPSEIVEVAKEKLTAWLQEGLKKLAKKRRDRRACGSILQPYLHCLGEKPEILNILKSFDFEFCPFWLAFCGLMHISFSLLIIKGLSTRELSKLRKERKIAQRAIPSLIKEGRKQVEALTKQT